ncbi:MAG: hypothetical protein IID41_00245 [Planctomycetes bacterium]|nr:hypothetical protein [Planctomycetota bacterium]
MKIERAWLRIIVSAIVAGVASLALYAVGSKTLFPVGAGYSSVLFLIFTGFFAGPAAATVLAHVLTPKVILDGHTRCGKCGYILKGLTEPRCSECGERI